jgi:hypothetical protein
MDLITGHERAIAIATKVHIGEAIPSIKSTRLTPNSDPASIRGYPDHQSRSEI